MTDKKINNDPYEQMQMTREQKDLLRRQLEPMQLNEHDKKLINLMREPCVSK